MNVAVDPLTDLEGIIARWDELSECAYRNGDERTALLWAEAANDLREVLRLWRVEAETVFTRCTTA